MLYEVITHLSGVRHNNRHRRIIGQREQLEMPQRRMKNFRPKQDGSVIRHMGKDRSGMLDNLFKCI